MTGVCFLTFNSSEVIAAAVRAAIATKPTVEMVVVDNASTDGTQSLVRGVSLIQNTANLGYSQGNNIGAAHLLARNCAYLAFVNPDVLLRPDTLPQMRAVLAANPHAGCVGGCWEGKGTTWWRTRPGFFAKLGWHHALTRRFLAPPPQTPRIDDRPVYAVLGPCIMFPASVFRAIGGFDGRAFLGHEEMMVSERLSALGYHVLPCPAARYAHIGSHSSRRFPEITRPAALQSEQLLVREYYRWRTPLPQLLFLARRFQFAVSPLFHPRS